VLNHTLNVAAAPAGAVFTGACTPWTSLSAVRVNPVRMPNPVLAAGAVDARPVAFRPVPVPMSQLGGVAAELPATFENRNQTVHKTRINAGGYGAMGPHPEREPA
jgi:hypothetical protein